MAPRYEQPKEGLMEASDRSTPYTLTSAAEAGSEPTSRLAWGRWTLDPDLLVLELGDHEVDLEICLTPARVLDVIAQIHAKQSVNTDDLGNLVEALCDLLKPQATLCSWRQPKEIKPSQLSGIVRRNAGVAR
jgi:hypothetical protein